MWFAGAAPLINSVRHGALRPGFHLEAGQRIGLFGGSFNPAHQGHRHVAETARRHLGLDKILWLISPQNPLKSGHETAPLQARITELGPYVGPHDLISDFETRIGTQYTFETLQALKARFRDVHFVWIMGADNLAHFHRWRGWVQIARMMPIAVVSRPGSLSRSRTAPAAARFRAVRLPSRQARLLPGMTAPAWVFLRGPLHPQSSTLIRRLRQIEAQTRKDREGDDPATEV